MPYLTLVLRDAVKNTLQKSRKKGQSFLDSLRIYVQGGSGGMGQPKYGGVGGRGGRVYVEAKDDMTLVHVKKSMPNGQRVKASVGGDSSSRCILGRPGNDVVIQCPTGVSIVNELGYELGEVLQEGDTVMVAEGGMGGGPTNGYCGNKGQAHHIRLDLKLIADVAFVGFPNAGKSTLLSKLSRATPKIASYPFTTLKPTVGLVSYEDERTISLADLPGLIEGAHVNRGLGHRFLRHVERSRILLVVVDVQGFQLSHKWPRRSCTETILLLNKEVELYKDYLLGKPTMLLINKMDTDGAKERLEEVMHNIRNLSSTLKSYPESIRPVRPFEFLSVQSISAEKASETELNELKKEIRRVMDLETASEDVDKEVDLLNELKQAQREYGPSLV